MAKRPRILYAVQATGNGHLSRCLEFYPVFSKYADVDVLLSGIQGDLELPFPVKYRFHGWGYVFGKNGGVDIWATTKSLKPLRFLKDVWGLDLSQYDRIVNDFEPISAYARKWRYKNLDCVALSHQAAFFSKKIPRPKRRSWFAEFIFKHFAPATKKIGFHFQNYDSNVFTPVIRKDIRELSTDYLENEVLVYLPSFSGEILFEKFSAITNYQFRIFSKHDKQEKHVGNLHLYPVDKSNWIKMLGKCSYAIMGAGFQGVSEMLYLKKKIMAIPMAAQYEQKCNAVALSNMGVAITDEIVNDFGNVVSQWLEDAEVVDVDFPDHTEDLVLSAMQKTLA